MVPVLDIFLSGLVSAVMKNLVNEVIKKIAAILKVKQQMEALQRNMMSIRSLLVDAESKKIESNSITLWLAELREVLYEAEDLLDDFAAAKKSVSESESNYEGLIIDFFSTGVETKQKNNISKKIKNINDNLRSITSQTSILQLLASQPNADNEVSRFNSSRITDTCSIQLDSDVVGIDDDAKQLAYRIIRDSNRAHSLFAITGMGGIGKTTLARKVFNHHLIQDHFNKNTVWVCVSSNCTGEYLLKKIVRSIDKNYSESRDSLDELTSKVIEVVKEKRVFIVLDDIWDSHVWEKFLRAPLYTGANYSRILVTTRNQEVAMKMNAVHTHPMTNMLESDGWSMLCKIVFNGEDSTVDMNKLEKVGKEIVHRCKGLPLTIKVVGGVLRMTDRTTAAWKVLSSTTWSMQNLPEDILASLLLSYEDLPSHLKRCFIYCSLFPQDFNFHPTKLLYMWIAEGFIQKEEGTTTEESAKEYYNQLVMRNLLQVTLYSDGSSRCKMHDLLHSLAIFVSQNQYIYVDSKTFGSSGSIRHRHLRFDVENMNVLPEEIIGKEYVRTLMLSEINTIPYNKFLSGLTRLKVLDLEGMINEEILKDLGNMIQLRFLSIYSKKKLTESNSPTESNSKKKKTDCSKGSIKFFRTGNNKKKPTESNSKPTDWIGKLKNLETLRIVSVDESRSLPQGIGELRNLRHLLVSDKPENMPNGLDNLKNLRVLDCFVVNDHTSTNMKELKNLSELTDLSIHHLERVASKKDAKEAAIEMKTSLKCLKLHCEQKPRISDEDNIRKIEEVFAGIEIPENLTELSIDGFFGKHLPDLMGWSRLHQVKSLELKNCKLLKKLPSLGEFKFPKLQDFRLMEMKELVNMFEVEIGAFPCLVNLHISDCPKLKSLGEGLQHATCLKKMTVRDLDELESIENLSSISELEISRNKKLRSVKNLPSLKKMDINECSALVDEKMKTLPEWLKNIIASKIWHRRVTVSEELVFTEEDWMFISKLIEVKINGVKVDSNFRGASSSSGTSSG